MIKGKKKKAHSLLTAEMQLEISDADVLVSIGSMLLAAEDFNSAVTCLLKAVTLGSADGNAYYYLGLANALKGHLAEAARFFAHTLDIRPEHVLALKDSAVVCLAMGRVDDAERKIKKAITLAKDVDGCERGLARLRLIGRRIAVAKAVRRVSNFVSFTKSGC